jgi:hypothetical protein
MILLVMLLPEVLRGWNYIDEIRPVAKFRTPEAGVRARDLLRRLGNECYISVRPPGSPIRKADR